MRYQIVKLIYKSCNFRKRLAIKICTKLEGGAWRSQSLRRLFKETEEKWGAHMVGSHRKFLDPLKLGATAALVRVSGGLHESRDGYGNDISLCV